MPRFEKLTLVLVLSALTIVFPSNVSGQKPEQVRRIQEEKRKRLDAVESKILSEEGRLLLEWGGWIDMRYDQYNEDDNNASLKDTLAATSSLDTRLWI